MPPFVADSQPGLEVDRSKEAGALHSLYSGEDDGARPIADERAQHLNGPVCRNPFNLSPLWFGIAVAISTALLVGGAVGTGLGVTKAQKCNSQSNFSPSTTSNSSADASTALQPTLNATVTAQASAENYTPLAPNEVKLLSHACPTTGYTYQVNDAMLPAQDFTYECGVAYLGNTRDVVDTTLMQPSAYTPQQCVEACGGLNVWRNATVCSAVTFQASMSAEYRVGRGNCWLFSQVNETWDDPAAETSVSARLY